MERDELILIGPIRVGKSTVAKLAAEKTGLPRCSMDSCRWEYFAEIGYDHEHAKQIKQEHGFPAVYEYWKPFEAHAVQRLLADHSDCVIDFGAGHSVFEDKELFGRVRDALAEFRNVVLLLPCEDDNDSIEALAARAPDQSQEIRELNAHLIRHHSNRSLARHIVYTNGRTAEETADDVLHVTGMNT